MSYRAPARIRLMRPALKSVFRLIFHALGRVKISGMENVPRHQPYIVAMNHVSIFDPPFVVSFWPETAEVIGASDVFEKKGQGTILKLYGVIPVHRGDYDRALMDTILDVLKSGQPLVIAPEGGRSHEPALRKAKPGVGYIIEHSAAPVAPVGIVGTTDDYWQRAKRGERPLLEMRIGKLIHFPPMTEKGAARREARQRYADMVMNAIAGLLPEEYRGVYASSAVIPSA